MKPGATMSEGSDASGVDAITPRTPAWPRSRRPTIQQNNIINQTAPAGP